MCYGYVLIVALSRNEASRDEWGSGMDHDAIMALLPSVFPPQGEIATSFSYNQHKWSLTTIHLI